MFVAVFLWRRVAVLLTAISACACLLAVGAVGASGAPAAGQAAWLYDPGRVVVIDLTLSPESEAELEDDPDEWVPGGFKLYTTDGVPGGDEHLVEEREEVGIRLKGQGSFRPLGRKAAFKVKFEEFDEPKFEDLKKMTLNNMVHDPSMIHETMAYSLFRAVGVPASRTGYAWVRVNGDPYGMYVNVEDMDDQALERIFGDFDKDVQHLYEGEYNSELVPGGAGKFEIDEGDEENIADLEALIDAVNAVSPAFSVRMESVADLREMTRMWGVEKYIGMWDGYAGLDLPLSPNNFYLYSDPHGVFQMFPWGTDLTWELPLRFDGSAGLMFDQCLADTACLSTYRESLGALRETLPTVGLDALAVQASELLRPWQEAEVLPWREYSAEQIQGNVDATRAFVSLRPGELDQWLFPDKGASPPPLPAVVPEVGSIRPRFHTSKRSAVIHTRLVLPGPGGVRQSVKMKTRRGQHRVCTAHAKRPRGGKVILRCRLSPLARKHLAARWLKFTVLIRFNHWGAGTATVRRKVFVPRTPRRR